MQGMRIKSHKGYFTNPQQNRVQSRATWAPRFFSAPRPAPAAPVVKTAPVVKAAPVVKTAPLAKATKTRVRKTAPRKKAKTTALARAKKK